MYSIGNSNLNLIHYIIYNTYIHVYSSLRHICFCNSTMSELDYDCHLYFQSHTISEERDVGEGEKGTKNDTHIHTYSNSSSGSEHDNNLKADAQAYLEQKIGTGKIDVIGGTNDGSSGSGSVEVRATLEVQVTAPCGYTDIISFVIDRCVCILFTYDIICF